MDTGVDTSGPDKRAGFACDGQSGRAEFHDTDLYDFGRGADGRLHVAVVPFEIDIKD